MKKTNAIKKILITITFAVILLTSVMIMENWTERSFMGPEHEIPTGLMGGQLYQMWDLNHDSRMQFFELFYLADIKIKFLFSGLEGLWFIMIIQFVILTIILQEIINKKSWQLK